MSILSFLSLVFKFITLFSHSPLHVIQPLLPGMYLSHTCSTVMLGFFELLLLLCHCFFDLAQVFIMPWECCYTVLIILLTPILLAFARGIRFVSDKRIIPDHDMYMAWPPIAFPMELVLLFYTVIRCLLCRWKCALDATDVQLMLLVYFRLSNI